MGSYNKGIMGAFSGKVGPVVGARWRGKEVMRSLPRKSTKPPTLKQAEQRQKFTLVAEFLRTINPIVSRFFGGNNEVETRRNLAMSYTMKEAVTFVDPDYVLKYNRVLISRGNLLGLNGATVTPAVLSIEIAWTDNSGVGDAQPTDRLVVAVYEPTSKTTIYSLDAGARDHGHGVIAVPALYEGLPLQVWATFVSVDDKLYATSEYLGTVTVG